MTGATIATEPRLGHPRYDVQGCTRGVLLPARPLAVQAGLRSAWRSRAFLTARPGAVRMELPAVIRARRERARRSCDGSCGGHQSNLGTGCFADRDDNTIVETTSWPLPRFRSAHREAMTNAGLLALAVALIVVAWHLLAVR